ncbi:uncharacterized protein LOC109705704 [Ananas comosus]|uniref:Uncharacterized protein LOC109705704 n=1 Tax=Ananas comosus TaxID=4615 RepID=A0A6P5EKT6_ANACO|nr:uncharacterized protein LOC109705704 [Ananas comosus]
MRQRRRLELLKDYDLTILYHPGKANVVADARSRKSVENLVTAITSQPLLQKEMQRFGLEVVAPEVVTILAALVVRPTLLERIKERQVDDSYLQKVWDNIDGGRAGDFGVGSDGALRFRNRLCVPKDDEVRKMKDMGKFVAQCLTCQQVKTERRFPAEKLQSLPIPVWKWEDIAMDFVVGLP